MYNEITVLAQQVSWCRGLDKKTNKTYKKKPSLMVTTSIAVLALFVSPPTPEKIYISLLDVPASTSSCLSAVCCWAAQCAEGLSKLV